MDPRLDLIFLWFAFDKMNAIHSLHMWPAARFEGKEGGVLAWISCPILIGSVAVYIIMKGLMHGATRGATGMFL